MTFFYDLNKRLADLAKKQNLTEGAKPDFLDLDKDGNKTEPMKKAAKEVDEASYSAKAARAGKDIGKPGKMFSKIAKSAGERYGSKERGEKVAGAVLAKLRAKKESVEQDGDVMDYLNDKLKDFDAQQSKTDESALQAYLGKKKYGETGMKALQKAGREGASKETMAKIRAKHDKMDEQATDEGNEFSGALVKARAQGAKEFEVDGKKYQVTSEKKEPKSKGTAFDPEVAKGMFAHKSDKDRYDVKDTGYSKRYTRKAEPEDEQDDEVKSDAPKKKGRPKGPDKGPERVTAKSYKYKAGRPAKTKEDLDTDGVMMNKPSNMSSEGIESIALVDKGEYDREGEMAKQQIHTIMRAAKNLHKMLGDDENLPEWVQKKITLAQNYIDGVADYMTSRRAEAGEQEPVAEKAVSQQQQKFMGMAHAMQKGEKIKGASPELKKVAKTMKKSDVKDFAATKHKGLPKKVKEETAEEPKAKKGGFEFGKGVYENFNNKYTKLLNEGMNVSVNMSTGADGQPSKNITVSADGDDAEALAKLLQMAGISGHSQETCSSCGSSPCGCEEQVDENSPDWPTNTETSDDALQYAGGLNKPKSTGQTTVPVIASQLRRQVSMEEGVELERSLFRLYQNYKAQ